MNEDLVTMTIELDQEVYDQASELFQSLGTTIEDMTVAFLKFCVIPENLPLLKAYLGIENAPAEAGARMELHHRVFKQVFDIATKNTRYLIEYMCLCFIDAVDSLLIHLNVTDFDA